MESAANSPRNSQSDVHDADAPDLNVDARQPAPGFDVGAFVAVIHYPKWERVRDTSKPLTPDELA